ncbi:MAG: O-antigen ligase family protein, partial [Candidatus Hydrogenedentes bacterium]|nr:O-antigen ligase family protein [Candidatus Hydrogenedentota bacterium]
MTDVDAKRDPGVRAIRAIAAVGAAATILALWPGTHSPPQDPKYFLIGTLPLFMGIAWLAERLRRKHGVIATGLPFYFLTGFLLLQFVAAIFSERMNISLAAFAPFFALGLIAFLVAQGVRTTNHAWTLLCWIAVAVALSSVYGLAQKAGWDPFPWAARDIEEYRGLPSTYGNPNIATHCLNLALLILAGLSFRRGTRWCAVLLVPIALHLYFTEVRAARVAVPAGAGIVLLAWIYRRVAGSPQKTIAWTCATALLAALALGSAAMIYTKWSTGAYLPTGHSLLLRYNGYYGASQMIADRPLLGFGPGTYRIENVPYWTPYEETTFATDAKYNAHVHNEYLESGVEAGFGGAFSYIGFIVSLTLLSLNAALSATDRDKRILGFTLAACFTAFAIDGLFGFNLRSPASATIFFILAGVLTGTSFAKSPKSTVATRRTAFLPVACCAVAFALAAAAGAVFASQILRQKATAAYTLGYPQQALVFLGQAQRISPWDADILRQTAEVHATTGRTRDAIDMYREALRLNPYWVMDHVSLARQYFQLSVSGSESFLRQATESAERALALCATLPGAHELLGRIALAQSLDRADSGQEPGDKGVREAIDHFQKALHYGVSDREQVHRMTAQAHLILGQIDEAERAY